MGFHRVARQRHLPSLHMLYCLNSLCEEERHKCDGYISVQHTVLLALYAMLSFVHGVQGLSSSGRELRNTPYCETC